MTSDKTFSQTEFTELAKKFAQQVANKIPGGSVTMRNDPLTNGVIISVEQGFKSQHTGLKLNRDGSVTMTNILGNL
ncbi:hypothetical protein EBPHNEJP_00025 [Salmonella phage CF-SP2]|nr:hypothetical protein EBPHNEJP_00025 [Salmonella phage CF-SP2]